MYKSISAIGGQLILPDYHGMCSSRGSSSNAVINSFIRFITTKIVECD